MRISSTIYQTIYRVLTTTLTGIVCLLLLACYDYDHAYEEVQPINSHPVKTQLSFAFSGVKAAKTRMSEDIVQGQTEPVFRGIQNITLASYANNPDAVSGGEVWTPILLPVNDAYPSPDSPTQFYADIEVPSYTSRFLFYAEARAESNDKHVNGCLNPNGLSFDSSWTPDNISFNLQSISTGSDQKAVLLAAYMTNIAHEMSAQGLEGQYNKLIKNIAGSSASVLALIKQLYVDIEDASKKTAVGDVIQADAGAYSSIYNGITGNMATIDASGITDFNDALKDYPENIGLPDGAAYMAWVENVDDQSQSKFEPNTDHSTISSPVVFSGASLSTYAYPPSLYYWVDSAVRTTSTIHMYHYADWLTARQLGYAVDGVQDYDTSWKHFLDMNEYEQGSVDVYSHSVALADEIRYAVGRLDITVKAESATLKDAQNRQVHFTSSAFPITGILIGDQREVNYEFKQKDIATTYIVYDTEMPEGMVLSTSGTSVNSTLVLQSKLFDGTATAFSGLDDADKKTYSVNIAVEFQNNSGFDFYGYSDNPDYKPIIPSGTKFYLVGKLEMDAEQAASQGCVFKQGTITRADFVVNSFKNAYNVVPDLRNPRLMLGLTANLYWQKGVKLSSPEDL